MESPKTDKETIKQIVKTRLPSILSKKVREETRLGNLQPSHVNYILQFVKSLFRSEEAIVAIVWEKDDKFIYVQPKNDSILTVQEFNDAFRNYTPKKDIEKNFPIYFNIDFKVKIVRDLKRYTKDKEKII